MAADVVETGMTRVAQQERQGSSAGQVVRIVHERPVRALLASSVGAPASGLR